MELGLTSLGDHLPDIATGRKVPTPTRFREIVDYARRGEELGFDAFHLGEHHFCDYVVSSPQMVLAAVGERTRHLRLSTAVTLLPHHDPVRVAEDYGTLDVLSDGRAELIVGRGVYPRHYAAFGQDADDSRAMVAEKVDLLRRLWSEEDVTWTGRFRTPLAGVTVHPRPVQQPHPPIWMSASSPDSVDAAAAAGCPIAIPTVSTGVEAAAELAHRYRDRWSRPGSPVVALHLHVHVGDDTDAARSRWFPYQVAYLRWVLWVRSGQWGDLPPHLGTIGEPASQALCGSAEQVLDEIGGRLLAIGGADRLLVQFDQGGFPAAEVHASLERFAADVVPHLPGRELVGS